MFEACTLNLEIRKNPVPKTGFGGRFKMNFLDTWKVSPKATVQGRGAIKTAAC